MNDTQLAQKELFKAAIQESSRLGYRRVSCRIVDESLFRLDSADVTESTMVTVEYRKACWLYYDLYIDGLDCGRFTSSFTVDEVASAGTQMFYMKRRNGRKTT